MKISKMHALGVVIGVIVGIAALWAGGAPVLDDGDLVLGGHEYRFYLYQTGMAPIGCTSENGCYFCEEMEWAVCSDYYDGSQITTMAPLTRARVVRYLLSCPMLKANNLWPPIQPVVPVLYALPTSITPPVLGEWVLMNGV
jgi:hypothetical protein